ncbi:MAG TPA: glycosyltransferase 61 family protein [Burkholderiales bacterium]|nr:glycosyltransferase 61 family protein [Burkholderiales bacterium]
MDRLIGAVLRLHASGRPGLARAIARAALFLRPRHPGLLRVAARLATERGDLEAAEIYGRKIVARAPEDASIHRALGDVAVLRGQPERALPHYDAHAKLTLGPDAVTRIYRHRWLDAAGPDRPAPYYRRLEHVFVDTAYWSIMTDAGEVYAADTHGRTLANGPFVRGRAWDQGRSVIASFEAPRITVAQECIFVGGDDNYSHWVMRNLLKLVALERDGLLHSLPWLLNTDLTQYQRDYLDLLGVPPERRLLVDRGQVVRCENVIVPAMLRNPLAIRQGVEWLRARLAAHLATPEEAADRLFVSRADAVRRRLVNEEEIYAALERYGFRKVVPGRMTALEQIAAFSRAKIVVGAHGAGLTNMVFAPPHASFVELCSVGVAHMEDFRRTARATGQPIYTLVSDRTSGSDAQADYEVDVQAVVAQVERI